MQFVQNLNMRYVIVTRTLCVCCCCKANCRMYKRISNYFIEKLLFYFPNCSTNSFGTFPYRSHWMCLTGNICTCEWSFTGTVFQPLVYICFVHFKWSIACNHVIDSEWAIITNYFVNYYRPYQIYTHFVIVFQHFISPTRKNSVLCFICVVE